ncbi:MAG: ATPase [Muribaculum sp.]|nr:ATPase [Muribaculaceae bacterium]MCM1080823.1 ATPase [Muribaculum sp.]
MKLIADSGSTKVEWCVLDGGKVIRQLFTSGFNALMLTEEEISQYLDDELVSQLGETKSEITEVYFYGAGCIDEDVCRSMRRALRNNLPEAIHIEANSDLLGAARALFGLNEGIACILGTGANSGYYNGSEIKDHVSPLGYILGDEGSGAVLGRHLIGDVLKHQLPRELCERFLDEYNLESNSILRRVYKEPMPNRFLASVTPFLLKNIEEPAIHRLVLNEFKSFFVRNVAQYDRYRQLPVSFVGSIAYLYRPVLLEAADALDTNVATVLKSPMEGLVGYHSAN